MPSIVGQGKSHMKSFLRGRIHQLGAAFGGRAGRRPRGEECGQHLRRLRLYRGGHRSSVERRCLAQSERDAQGARRILGADLHEHQHLPEVGRQQARDCLGHGFAIGRLPLERIC